MFLVQVTDTQIQETKHTLFKTELNELSVAENQQKGQGGETAFPVDLLSSTRLYSGANFSRSVLILISHITLGPAASKTEENSLQSARKFRMISSIQRAETSSNTKALSGFLSL